MTRRFSTADSTKFSPACPFSSSPLMPGVAVTCVTCAASAASSIEKSSLSGTIVAAWMPARREAIKAVMYCFRRV